ncbi:DEHA2C13398p [Debaryomyces hansenii CBS767]|uniref:DEHA2C13398p n=1 Tax=Debaryomyces hansenii (strain ATCC 36239 / CBS 767 / BCRC 21394 / JCM 1990 / NBRC 0083 / IGC 2968) TaxID=284592 RepID=Q6BU58_DEBHA|nr:DEHA2C13398p [Debaryomyces hansenii CBS767]CAG86338.2 DEHA2C13398p [Debaryomyces hansenii CBS767]|eukprot:XP_458261.2 DEHA2C13398p [Debaryomyces hansenii CBS767]
MGGYADEVSSFNVNTNNTIALKMIRQLAFRQTTALRAGLVPATRYISTTPARYSIIGSAKDVLHKANKKIGEVAAEGIEKTQHATPHSVGDAAQKVNKKTGEVLAEGIDKTQKATPDSVGDAAQKVNKKTGEVLAEGIEKTQQGKERLRVSQNAKGYDSLQDKGSKTETEQNRPDDAV